MTSNYYVLQKVVRELDSSLRGDRFSEAYSIRPNELRIRFESGAVVVAVLVPINGALWLSRSAEQPPRSNAQRFFASLGGETISAITISDRDRLICLNFGARELRLFYYGHPNAMLYASGEIAETFKKQRGEIAASEAAPAPARLLGRKLERAIAERGIDSTALERELAAPGLWLFESPEAILVSPIELVAKAVGTVRYFERPSDAVRIAVSGRARAEALAAKRKRLADALERAERRVSHSLAALQNVDSHPRKERLQLIGNALLMRAHEIARHERTVHLTLEEGSEISVEIPSDKTVYEIAAKYFERARRSGDEIKELAERGKRLERELELILTLTEKLPQADSLKALEQLERSLGPLSRHLLGGGGQSEELVTDPSARFRRYRVAGGLRVLVGKNAKQNDELTLHVAKKEDLWLHARGVAGSHVVLQCHALKHVPGEAIEQAAEIAAFYSDARSQTVAPVAYTKRKYVRKPKGAAPGAVKLEREDVVDVRPQIRGREE